MEIHLQQDIPIFSLKPWFNPGYIRLYLRYFKKNAMNKHNTKVHEGKKTFKCESSDKSFVRKQNLNEYVVAILEGKKPFKCFFCNARFTSKA